MYGQALADAHAATQAVRCALTTQAAAAAAAEAAAAEAREAAAADSTALSTLAQQVVELEEELATATTTHSLRMERSRLLQQLAATQVPLLMGVQVLACGLLFT